MDKNIKNFNQFIYNDANIHAEKILESILPQLRESLAKAYTLGFMKAMSIQKIKQDKENRNN